MPRQCTECIHYEPPGFCHLAERGIVPELGCSSLQPSLEIYDDTPMPSPRDIEWIPDDEFPENDTRNTKKSEEKPKKYKSKDGFELVPLRRGFTEIAPLWKLLEKVISSTKEDCFICGGYARYCASPKFDPVKASDIDVYSEGEKAYKKIVKLLKQKKLKVKAENDMAITFDRPATGAFHYMPLIQVIKPLTKGKIVSIGNKIDILSNFDFTVIRAAIESPTEIVVDADFVHDESHNLIRIKNIHCPISSTLRCLKYATKGYWLRPMECLKLFLDWGSRTQNYRDKLVEFLDKANEGEGLTQEEVDELEALMRID